MQQGDIGDAAEPYFRGREIDQKSLEKAKNQSKMFCKQLSQYRMPFAWAAINIVDVIIGKFRQPSLLSHYHQQTFTLSLALPHFITTPSSTSSHHQNPHTITSTPSHHRTHRLCSSFSGNQSSVSQAAVVTQDGGGAAGTRDRRDSDTRKSVDEKSLVSTADVPRRKEVNRTSSVSSMSGRLIDQEYDESVNLSQTFNPVTLTLGTFFKQVRRSKLCTSVIRFFVCIG